MPTFYYQPSLYLYDQIEKLICPNTWTLSSGTPLTDWRSSSVLQSCRVTVHGCFCVLSSGRKGSEVLTLPKSHASALDMAVKVSLCGGLIQNGNEWAKILWVRGRRTYFIGTRIFPGDCFTRSTYYQAIPGTSDFQGLLHKITFFTCESKKYWIRKYQSNIRPMFQNVLNWHSITEYEINVKQWLCIKIQETEKDTHRCLQNVRRLPEAF